jgi:hypothetical protein
VTDAVSGVMVQFSRLSLVQAGFAYLTARTRGEL